MLLLAVSILQPVTSVCVANDDAPTNRTFVDVRADGDDGLTQRLADALEKAFRGSPDFTVVTKAEKNTLAVVIPTNVDWRKLGKRTQVLTPIEFSSDDTNKILKVIKIACWDDMLSECADRVVKDAKGVASKVR
jgi:hypothetical protein